MARRGSAQAIFDRHAAAAARLLCEIMENPEERTAVRLDAAQEVLRRALGRGPDGPPPEPVRFSLADDLEEFAK